MEKVWILYEEFDHRECNFGCTHEKVVGIFSTLESLKAFVENDLKRSWAYHYWEEFEVQK
jgi:hypothetical protein